MNTFISHNSAAIYWNIPYISAVLGPDVDGADTVHIATSERDARYALVNRTIHLCELDLPREALVTKNGVTVAAPEFAFLQLASKLSLLRLILLGLQLCAHPPGDPTMAITTKQNISALLAKIPGHRGLRKSLKAIKYIENGSASVMESLAFMILTLPNCYGGFGLDGAVFNQQIKLAAEGAKDLGQKHCFVDLYYKSANLAVEYDSFAFHNTPAAQGKDMMRSAILERQGIDVMHFSTIQLYNKDAFTVFALNLARRLGRRIRIRTNKFNKMHEQLRELLPTGEFTYGPYNGSDNGLDNGPPYNGPDNGPPYNGPDNEPDISGT